MRAHGCGKVTRPSHFWEFASLSALSHKSMPGIEEPFSLLFPMLSEQSKIQANQTTMSHLKTMWFSPYLSLVYFLHLRVCRNTHPLGLSSRFAVWEGLPEPDGLSLLPMLLFSGASQFEVQSDVSVFGLSFSSSLQFYHIIECLAQSKYFIQIKARNGTGDRAVTPFLKEALFYYSLQYALSCLWKQIIQETEYSIFSWFWRCHLF